MPRHLQKRRRLWYAALDIPQDVRHQFGGKLKFVQSLGTDSQAKAEVKAMPVIAHWKAKIAGARTNSSDPLIEIARSWNEILASAKDEGERDAFEFILTDRAEVMEQETAGTGVRAYKVATGQYTSTEAYVTEWFATLDNEPKTLNMKRSDLKLFTAQFPVITDIDRKGVVRWINAHQQKHDLAAGTTRRIISACRGYWSYLQSIEVAPDDVDPFKGVVKPRGKKTKAEVSRSWIPYKPEEAVKLLTAAAEKTDTKGQQLTQLIWLAMWTGCRIEELCALTIDRVHQDHITLDDAKTETGWREVPIHSHLADLLNHLKAVSSDGYILPELPTDKYGDRSPAIGKRFGHMKTALGFSRRHVFHSFRGAVVTQLDHAGIRENVTADIVGHDKPTLTYGLYSGGSSLAVKKEAIERLEYPQISTTALSRLIT